MKTIELNKIYNGNSLDVLKIFPDNIVDCVVTSPPYWALRDYGVEGQLGLEKTFQEYVSNLCDIFDEIKRVLKEDGTCWVNIGDTYISKGEGRHKGYNDPKYKNGRIGRSSEPNAMPQSLCEKNLAQIPARFSIEMQNRGWILRNEIIWHKPNAMPSSIKDRFTVDFEKIFLFVKNKRYYFETQYEEYSTNTDMKERKNLRIGRKEKVDGINQNITSHKKMPPIGGVKQLKNGNPTYSGNSPLWSDKGRNKRCVWTIPTKPFREAHFATYPESLIETPIKAGCPVNGIVLDPFMGAGTTALVSKKLNRNYIGIELNKEYIDIANKRINNVNDKLNFYEDD